MKTKLLFFFLLVSTTLSLFAQDSKFEFTLEYSPNYSKVTNQFVDEDFKLSHNLLFRVAHRRNGKVRPTIGLGFINTGEFESLDIGGTAGVESIKFIHNYNYVYIPIGLKVNISKVYLLPEIGFGINLSNKTKQVTEFSDGRIEKTDRDGQINFGEFNSLTFPLSLSIGTEFKIRSMLLSTGLKGYYSLNSVVKDVPRKSNYFGLGIILGVSL